MVTHNNFQTNVPLNYLRNVGLNSSTTMYTFYNDVDLVPVPGTYQLIKHHLRTFNIDEVQSQVSFKIMFCVNCKILLEI